MGAAFTILFRPLTFVIHHFVTVMYVLFAKKLHNSNLRRLEENSTCLLENQQELKDFVLICLEKPLYENDQIKSAIEHLKEIAPNTASFNDPNKCERWLNQNKVGKITVLIISKTLGKQIIPRIHRLSSIKAIYLYHVGRKNSKPWTKKYSKVQGDTSDFNELTQQVLEDQYVFFPSYMLTKSTQTVHEYESLEQGKEIPQGHLTNFQFVLIDLSTRLNEVAFAMLKCLTLLAKDSILIFDSTTLIDLQTLPQKETLLFVSSDYIARMENKLDHIKVIFILENDKSKADYRERFATGEQLIFHLADELYRCYQIEAKNADDASIAKMKENQANQIHVELKKAYKSVFKDNNIVKTPIDITTNIIWLRSKSKDDSEVKKLENLLSDIVPSIELFHDNIDCFNSLQKCGAVFLIIDANQNEIDPHQLLNVQVVYRYGKESSKNETMIDNYDDLCFQLITDLAIHYNKLGSFASARKEPKTARDMFMKASTLYTIVAKF